jgi:uncharacterized YccA/Bax inhibitor family protein
MRTANPALTGQIFETQAAAAPQAAVMTVNGAVVKTGILTAVLLAAAGLSWTMVFPAGIGPDARVNQEYATIFVLGGVFGGLITAFATIFVPRISPVTAPVYALFQGLFLGAISGLFAAKYQGIIIEAALLTVGVLGMMLLLYMTGIIRVTEKLKLGIIAATGAIFLFYMATMLLGLFGVGGEFRATVYGPGPIGIGISVVIVVVAALNLVLDFDVIETGARYGAPKYMEWYAAFGLLVTLIWLYLEILRLLAKLRSSNN